jgi:protein-disulfide isomerase
MLVITFGAVVLGVVAILALIAISGGFGGNEVEAVSRPDDPSPAEELRVGRSLGDPEAPVRIDAYEDPQCPACGLFNARIKPLLLAGPVTNGRVFFTYKDFPFLGPESFDAAVAMRVAEELDGKFWDFHDMLFHNQQGENQGAFDRDRLAEMAVLVGLDREAFLEAMDDPAYLAAVDAEKQEGVGLGVSSTPTLVVNGELMRGVPTWDDLRAAIDAAADAAAPAEEGS